MRIRTVALILTAALFVSFGSGCALLMKSEYYVVSEHRDEGSSDSDDPNVIEVKTYQGIKTAISTFVREGREQGVIKISGYDGDVSDAISKASMEVKKETAIGAYAVEDITNSHTRIVSYYEANIYINYRRTQEQIRNVMYLNYASAVQTALEKALSNHEDYLVISISSELVTEEYIRDYLREYYRSDPISVVALPEAEITVYQTDTLPKILEIELNYPHTAEQDAEMKTALSGRTSELVAGAEGITDAHTALNICRKLISAAEYAPEGSPTAYGTIMEGEGNSEGYAMAFKYLCSMLGIKCYVVEGELKGEAHFWNIIGVDRYYYHVDPYMCDKNGIDTAFLKTDIQMRTDYKWPEEDHKACNGSLTFKDLQPQA